MTGADIVREARTWLAGPERKAVKYKHQGRSREGVDCAGLPACVRADLGMKKVDLEGYPQRSNGTEMLDLCRAHFIEVRRTEIQPGDVLVTMDGTSRHMAIVADYPGGGHSIIHSWLPNKKVVECRLDEEFMKTVRGCFRFPEVVG